MSGTIAVAAGFLVVLAVVFWPALRRSQAWQATVTPLASIIGSGFLVSAPLLAREAGNGAIIAMAALCAAAYLIGSAIRFNIAHAEHLLDKPKQAPVAASLERISHLVLAFAYFISVAYYLVLLSTFLFKGLGIDNPTLARVLTSAILASIGTIGFWRGLDGVQRVETVTVGLNLAVIGALLAGLFWYNVHEAAASTWHLGEVAGLSGLEPVRVVLGLLIVVQGFETSRFMGAEFDATTRIRAMRHAQWISTAIYLAFFALVTILFRQHMHSGGVAAVIDMVTPVAVILPMMLTVGAIASQFSASVADSIGAAGLIHDTTHGEVSVRIAYPLVAFVAILIVWETDVFGIINLASRAFALFYFVQSLVALLVARTAEADGSRGWRMTRFGASALLCLAVVLFAVPSGA
ncbi:MAG: hypothetical protein KDJ77_19895 [Rhodobiaceae bacterium]|nr:hypothetical protein [Rhodobiaceae bacterium]